jgi:hypothetical protein
VVAQRRRHPPSKSLCKLRKSPSVTQIPPFVSGVAAELTLPILYRTPGHQVEDVVKGEGEGETTESLGPGTATNVPSAAPPQAAETVAASTGAEGTSTAETTENGDSSNEEVEQVSAPGTAKRFSLAEHPGDGEGRDLRMPSSLPDTGAAAESEANENTLQGAVGKTQASKAGLVGSLDAGDGEGQGRCFLVLEARQLGSHNLQPYCLTLSPKNPS